MSKKQSGGKPAQTLTSRREFTGEFQREAVQMLLEGHRASPVVGSLTEIDESFTLPDAILIALDAC